MADYVTFDVYQLRLPGQPVRTGEAAPPDVKLAAVPVSQKQVAGYKQPAHPFKPSVRAMKRSAVPGLVLPLFYKLAATRQTISAAPSPKRAPTALHGNGPTPKRAAVAVSISQHTYKEPAEVQYPIFWTDEL